MRSKLSDIPSRRRPRSLLWVPPAAKRFDQMDAGGHLSIDGLRQRQLVGQDRPLGVDDDEVINQPLFILHLGDTKIVLGSADRLA